MGRNGKKIKKKKKITYKGPSRKDVDGWSLLRRDNSTLPYAGAADLKLKWIPKGGGAFRMCQVKVTKHQQATTN